MLIIFRLGFMRLNGMIITIIINNLAHIWEIFRRKIISLEFIATNCIFLDHCMILIECGEYVKALLMPIFFTHKALIRNLIF